MRPRSASLRTAGAAGWVLLLSAGLLAQSAGDNAAAGAGPDKRPPEAASALAARSRGRWLATFGSEQLRIWKAPLNLRRQDLGPAFLTAALAAGLIATDAPLSRLSTTAREGSLARASNTIGSAASWAGSLGFLGGYYLTGMIRHDDRQMETADLAFRSALHASLVTYAIKSFTGRERPSVDNHRGSFGNVGKLASRYESFPSGHASTAWAIAAVIAARSPSSWVKWTSYGGAVLVSASRVTAKKHFYADVFVGAYIGYKIGKYMVRKKAPNPPSRN